MDMNAEPFSRIDKRNCKIKKLLIEENIAIGTRNWDWADEPYNYIDSKESCPNQCKYCYIKGMNKRFGRAARDKDMTDEKRDLFVAKKEKVDKKWRKNKNKRKLIMFPSSHDIFPENVEDYCVIAEKIIKAGHQILCVTKPDLSCVKIICDKMKKYKNEFRFRFTIGTHNNELLKKWEPYAPSFQERLDSIIDAKEAGFFTSISAEPLLDDPTELIQMTEKYVDEIWIGPMSYVAELRDDSELFDNYNEVKKMLPDIFEKFKNHPKVWFKEGLRKMVCKKKFIDIEDYFTKNNK
jgi:DNA repair photolyase